jgi:hypothetical protein
MRQRRGGCGILTEMMVWGQSTRSARTAALFGTVLCVLLALFAIERKVAAYPTHSLATAAIAATGLQKPQPITIAEPQRLEAPVLCLCLLVVTAASPVQRDRFGSRSQNVSPFHSWAPTSLATRPPPAL